MKKRTLPPFDAYRNFYPPFPLKALEDKLLRCTFPEEMVTIPFPNYSRDKLMTPPFSPLSKRSEMGAVLLFSRQQIIKLFFPPFPPELRGEDMIPPSPPLPVSTITEESPPLPLSDERERSLF